MALKKINAFGVLSLLLLVSTIKAIQQKTLNNSEENNSYNDDEYLNSLSDEEYIDFVANFLRPTYIELLFVLIFFVLMVVGVSGNILVVYVVSRNKSMVRKIFIL